MKYREFKHNKELFKTKDLGDGITRISDVMGVSMYLIEGTRKAALIDTGIGIGELRPLVDLLTDKPVEVFLTHGHVDHGGGIYMFDKVYVSGKDYELLRQHTTRRQRLDFAAAYDPLLPEIEDIEEHMPYRSSMEIDGIVPGDQIDLGGRTLTVIDLKGHTQGSVGFYDDLTQTFFAGDGCNNSTFLFLRESSSVAEYYETLERISEVWKDRFKRIFICHGEILHAPVTVMEDLMACCNMVLSGKGSGVPFVLPYEPFRNGIALWAAPGEDSRIKKDGHFGNLIYCKDNVRKK